MSGIDGILGANLPTSGDQQARLKAVSKQMESVFVQQLFQTMDEREPEPEDGTGMGDSSATTMFQQLFHGQLAQHAAGGLGIADMVFKELAVRADLSGKAASTAAASPIAIPLSPKIQP